MYQQSIGLLTHVPGCCVSESKTKKSSRWSFFRKSKIPSRGKAVPPAKLGTDKPDPDDNLDTSFVLPELGGPNPHNKFDGIGVDRPKGP